MYMYDESSMCIVHTISSFPLRRLSSHVLKLISSLSGKAKFRVSKIVLPPGNAKFHVLKLISSPWKD